MFVQPDMAFKKHHPLVFKGFAATIPLGIAYLCAYLERAGHTLRVIDFQIGKYDMVREIERFKPDLLGLSICSPAITHAQEIVQTTRSTWPNLTIVAGGPHVTEFREQVFDTIPNLDLLVIGEGERTMVALAERMEKGLPYDDLKGIVVKKEGRFFFTGKGEVIKDLAELPRMPLHLFEVRKYYPLPGTFRRLPSIAMATTRGCPFKCTFCNSRTLSSETPRIRPPQAIVEEIEWLTRTYHAREIYFVDELFTLKRSHVMAFCEEMIRRQINIGWKCCSRVDTVDREMLQLMKQSGCFMISYGVESGDDQMLKRMKKGITTDQIRKTFRITREVGIERMAFFILNSYGETRASLQKTLQFSKELKPDFVNFELFKPFPGIEMRRQIEADPGCRINREIWDDWNEFTVGNHIFYSQNDLTEAFLKKEYEQAIKNFYLNIPFIFKSLIKMKSVDQFKCYLKTFLNMLSVKALDS